MIVAFAFALGAVAGAIGIIAIARLLRHRLIRSVSVHQLNAALFHSVIDQPAGGGFTMPRGIG